MEFTGRYVIPAAAEAVWVALNDPEVLKACINGCERMVKTDPTHFEAAVTLKIGPVKATFKGNVALEEMEPPHRCVLRGEGQGGVAGFAKGEAEIVLTPVEDGTALTYTAKASIGGKLAQIGQRLIDGASKQIADEFFAKFAHVVGATPGAILPEERETIAVEAAALAPTAEEEEARREGLAPEIWVVGLIGVIVILLILFGVVL
ncbi:MAG TPA: carbon monoxide dehydrogenase subunit G [Rhizomicrobium sp.]|nr:carbon monoxide dehydrogenase subunit G [Rhizomicrobium sp.]